MKNKIKKIISLVLVLAISFTISIPAFAAEKDENINKIEVQELVEKLRPYVSYHNGKAYLSPVDASSIGVSEKDLNEVKQALSAISVEKVNVHPSLSVDENNYGVYVRISVQDIKVGLTVGTLAAAILSVGGIVTGGTSTAIAGVIIGTLTSASGIWIDMLDTTIYIPNETFARNHGNVYIYNSKHTYTVSI